MNVYIDLDNARFANNETLTVGLRNVSFIEGETYDGTALVFRAGVQITPESIVLNLNDKNNSHVYRSAEVSGSNFALTVSSYSLRNEASVLQSLEALLAAAVVYQEKTYLITPVPVRIASNPNADAPVVADNVYIQGNYANVSGDYVSIQGNSSIVHSDSATISGNYAVVSGDYTLVNSENATIHGGTVTASGTSFSIFNGDTTVNSHASVISGQTTILGGGNYIDGGTTDINIHSDFNNIYNSGHVIINGDGNSASYGNVIISGFDNTISDSTVSIQGAATIYNGENQISGGTSAISGGNTVVNGNVGSISGGTNILSGSVKASLSFWMDAVYTGENLQEFFVDDTLIVTGYRIAAINSGRGPLHLSSGTSGNALIGPLTGSFYQRGADNSAFQICPFSFASGAVFQATAATATITGGNRVGISILSGLSGIGGVTFNLMGYQNFTS